VSGLGPAAAPCCCCCCCCCCCACACCGPSLLAALARELPLCSLSVLTTSLCVCVRVCVCARVHVCTHRRVCHAVCVRPLTPRPTTLHACTARARAPPVEVEQVRDAVVQLAQERNPAAARLAVHEQHERGGRVVDGHRQLPRHVRVAPALVSRTRARARAAGDGTRRRAHTCVTLWCGCCRRMDAKLAQQPAHANAQPAQRRALTWCWCAPSAAPPS
jgi:hypothetical protein